MHIRPANVIFPLGLGTALSLMGDATLYTVLPTHAADAGISMAGVGVILGVNRAIRLLTNAPTGLAYDRFPRRWLFVPALFIGALSTAIYAATHGFWPLFAGRLLWGLAWSGIWVGGATVIFDVTTVEDRGRWTGLYQTWFFLGSAIGSLSGGLLTDRIGYTSTMWVGALVTAVGAIVALLMLPETHNLRHKDMTIPGTALPNTTALRSNAGLWAAVSLQGLNRFVGYGVLSATLALLVQQQMKDTSSALGVASVTGLVMASRTLISMAAAPLCGSLSDLLKSRWLVTAAVVAAGALGVLLMLQSNLWGIVSGAVLTAISGGGIYTMTTTLTGDIAGPQQRGRAIGLLHTSGDLGSALGPVVAYTLLPFMALQDIYALCTLLLVIGLVASLYLYIHSARR